jgi:hypothetical protein
VVRRAEEIERTPNPRELRFRYGLRPPFSLARFRVLRPAPLNELSRDECGAPAGTRVGKTMMNRRHLAPLALGAMLIVGCPDGPSPGAADAGPSPEPAAAAGPSPESGSVSDPSPIDAGPEAGSPGDPCTPAGSSAAQSPTPGRCVSGKAVTCDSETARTRTVACGAETECVEYELEEKMFDRGNWQPHRTYRWAACLPTSRRSCEWFHDPAKTWLPAAQETPRCEGNARSECRLPPTAKYPDQSKDGWVLRPGTTHGFWVDTPCPASTTCRSSLSGNNARCIQNDATPCTEGRVPTCLGAQVVECLGDYGYTERETCAAGTACKAGCLYAACAPSSATSCDPAQPRSCSTPTRFTACSNNCLTTAEDCSSVLVYKSGAFQNVPGKCALLYGTAACAEATRKTCDPASSAQRCDGPRAVMCGGGLEVELDCSATARVCGVSASGIAGCKFANAPSCVNPPVGQASNTCVGSVLHGCCSAEGVAPENREPRCVPGYEAAFDCSTLRSPLACRSTPLSAYCGP